MAALNTNLKLALNNWLIINPSTPDGWKVNHLYNANFKFVSNAAIY